MENLEDLFNRLKSLITSLEELSKLCNPEIEVYQNITIEVTFDNPAHCFDQVVSWSYSLIFESLTKHYDFLMKQAKNLGISVTAEASEIKEAVHHIRTLAQHSLFDEKRYSTFAKFAS